MGGNLPGPGSKKKSTGLDVHTLTHHSSPVSYAMPKSMIGIIQSTPLNSAAMQLPCTRCWLQLVCISLTHSRALPRSQQVYSKSGALLVHRGKDRLGHWDPFNRRKLVDESMQQATQLSFSHPARDDCSALAWCDRWRGNSGTPSAFDGAPSPGKLCRRCDRTVRTLALPKAGDTQGMPGSWRRAAGAHRPWPSSVSRM